MEKVKVVLIGGPPRVGEKDRIRYVDDLTEKIKVSTGDGYEHFLANGESRTVGDVELPVFAWCGRTKVAE